MKFYEVGHHKASIERTSSEYYEVTIKDTWHQAEYKYLFSNLAQALTEILSYAEIDAVDFDERMYSL